MPEYLAPGVFVEELPPSLRAIEGVSTSTAAFVGPAERGPVAGAALPFQPDSGFTLQPDPAPLLVTSYSAFVRTFGQPLRLPTPTDAEARGYLGHAARVFFENGGRRLYVSRVVGANAASASHRVAQGVVARLSRRARAGDDVLNLVSLRGIDAGATVQLRRVADGSNPLQSPASPATLLGGAGPFSLDDQDTLTIQPQTTGATPSPVGDPAQITIDAHLAVLRSAVAVGTFAGLGGTTLDVSVNGGPTQQVSFTSDDVGDAALALSATLTGTLVSTVPDGGGDRIQITTEIAGSDASLTVSGSAAAILGFTTFGTPASQSNVGDVSAVTVTEIVQLFGAVLGPAHEFSVAPAPMTGELLFTSSVVPSGDITFAAPSGQMAVELGLGAATAGSAAQSAPDPVVASTDVRLGQIRLQQALPSDLDPAEVYLQLASAPPTAATGPLFHARNPGGWGNQLRVAIRPADRAPVDVTAVATSGSTTLQVRSTSSLYVGAVVEVDDGATATTHEVMDLAGTVVSLQPALPAQIPEGAGVRVLELDVIVSDRSGASPDEVFRGLSWNPRQEESILRRHYAQQINERSQLVFVQPPGIDTLSGSEGPSLTTQPTTLTGGAMALTGGGNEAPTASEIDGVLVGNDGGPGQRTGLQAFADIPDINLVAAPGHTTADVQLALIAHAEQLRYRFALLDGQPDPTGTVNEVAAHRSLYDSSHAAYYAPWVQVSVTGTRRYLPPSAFLAGIYARVDNDRGVWKAPANEVVRQALGLQTSFTTGEQEILNPQGVNLIRRFERGGIRVWGARTTSSDPSLRYVNVRRTLLFLEASIERSTQWVVFEPNTPETWSRVTQSVRSFLLTQWREGALFGRSETDAFFVRCDESTMTADDVLNGRLICQIGVAIVRPAEFVIFRIEQLTGFAQP
ncbi:MAG: phage tail sheath subtilisin-like domain-containing protein [Myxococcales bacterium]|nr:phage tail sheath subtilisin-like domain-containing protein [Myxococcales bacterium]